MTKLSSLYSKPVCLQCYHITDVNIAVMKLVEVEICTPSINVLYFTDRAIDI